MSDHVPEHRAEDDEPIIGDPPPHDKTLLSNSVYDKLRQVAAVWLPALAVFYITVAPFWGWPKQEEVAGTIMALDLLLGTGLLVLSRVYSKSDARFDGAIVVEPDEVEGVTNLNVSLDPEAIANKDEVIVKVKRV